MRDISRRIRDIEKQLPRNDGLPPFEECLRLRYEPHAGQRPFHEDRDEAVDRALIGGTGSGKTIAGVFEALWHCYHYPGIVGYCLEPNYPMVNRNLVPTLERLLGSPLESNPFVTVFNKSEYRLGFVNGSVLWLASLDDPESLEGANIDFVHVDEARLVERLDEAWRVIVRRLRGTGRGYPRRSWWTTTPDFPGSMLWNLFENPNTRRKNSRVYRMSVHDNEVNLGAETVDRIVKEHVGADAERFVWGRFAHEGSGSLAFDAVMHVFEEKMIDGEEWLINEGGQRIIPSRALELYSYGHDFGWTTPSAQLAVKWDGDGRAYAIDEYYKAQASNEDLLESAIELQRRYGEGYWFCDSSMPSTIDYLRGKLIHVYKNESRREDGVRELGSRLAKQGDGLCRLYVHKRCRNLISELIFYSVEKKVNDHAVDALRYAVMGGKPYSGEMQVSFGERPP